MTKGKHKIMNISLIKHLNQSQLYTLHISHRFQHVVTYGTIKIEFCLCLAMSRTDPVFIFKT